MNHPKSENETGVSNGSYDNSTMDSTTDPPPSSFGI